MTTSIEITDFGGRRVATAVVNGTAGPTSGTVDLASVAPSFLSLFRDYESAVNGQMLGVVDDLDGRVADLGIFAKLETGGTVRLTDVQLYPSTGAISFRVESASAGVAPLQRAG